MSDSNNDPRKDFNLLDELARGAIYRGGEDKEQFLTGYAKGIVGCVLVYGALWVIGFIYQQYR
jgi:hypothetical protein